MILFCLTCLTILSCSDESTENEIWGIWVPYEIQHVDGLIEVGPFTNRSIFGAYSESLQLNKDKTYIPVAWIGKDDYFVDTLEAGDLELTLNGKILNLFGGSWDMQFEVIRFANDELWLNYIGDISILGGSQTEYRFRRALKQ